MEFDLPLPAECWMLWPFLKFNKNEKNLYDILFHVFRWQ